jgi:phage terminase large subunit
VASALKTGLLKFHKNCGHLLDEIKNYAWSYDGAAERPVKNNDHACDALRYFVRSARIMKNAEE